MDKLVDKARELIVPERYQMTLSHMRSIYDEGQKKDGVYDIMVLAFNLGYIRGTNATKADYKKKQKRRNDLSTR